MRWTLCRLTTNLTADGAWHGLAYGGSGAPSTSIFLPVGGSGAGNAVVVGDEEILVRIGWCDAGGSPLAGAGVRIDAQPVTVDRLPHPTAASQFAERLSVGEARQGVAWEPLYLWVGPAGRVSVRLSAMDATGVAGATRAAVWIWTR